MPVMHGFFYLIKDDELCGPLQHFLNVVLCACGQQAEKRTSSRFLL